MGRSMGFAAADRLALSHPWRSRGFAVVGLVVLACGGITRSGSRETGPREAGTESGVGAEANVCKDPGLSCSSGAECCSGDCSSFNIAWDSDPFGKVCQPGGCAHATDSCSQASDLCLGSGTNCAAGRACTVLGAVCLNDAECCSGYCTSFNLAAIGSPYLYLRCDQPGCAHSGEPCQDESDCCHVVNVYCDGHCNSLGRSN